MLKKIIALLFVLLYSTANAVIILDSTYKKSGFKLAEDLAMQPQFKSLMFLDGEEGSGSGAWIGNYHGHGYVLTAAHIFSIDETASDFTYKTLKGKIYEGETLFLHPQWNWDLEERTGYDFAIVRLTKEVLDVGAQPALYEGDVELDQIITFMGYGDRGHGEKGEDDSLDTHDKPAAAEGKIELIEEAVTPVPAHGDAGNYLGIWLPKEDGSIENPLNEDGETTPHSELAGILGSGDSGGPAWIETNNGWAIAGINSSGTGNAAYGESAWFGQVSFVKPWIKSIIPTAHFIQ